MRQTDVAIIGAGLAGATAAAMLGRAGIDAVVVDPHAVYPADLRCEKIDDKQAAVLARTGLAGIVLPATAHARELWVARYGRLIEKRIAPTYGILYDRLVNTVRDAIPAAVPLIAGKVTAIEPGPGRQSLTLAGGEEIDARLVIVANGLNRGLRRSLGLGHVELSRAHSTTLGFDLAPVGRPCFAFPALTYYPHRARDRAAYLTLFPVTGGTMRANYMVYREPGDPWLAAFRDDPRATLLAMMPRLRDFAGEFEVTGTVGIRPADLCQTTDYLKPGIVLVGDAFATSCPAAGTGAGKALTDVERLCNIHIPAWLGTAGMDVGKIAAFYDDPVKRASDADSREHAYALRRLSTDRSLAGLARRLTHFGAQAARGALRARGARPGSLGTPAETAP
jgi:2-polyprenyl-6-methoxyphenol hydroxylase-like FAD-dependent oxidoreductase